MTGEDIIGIIIVSLLVGSLLADLILGVTWNKTHFTHGLTIFVKRIPVSHWYTNIPAQALLEKKFHSDVISSLVFKKIDSCSYGFREKLFQVKWIRTPNLMHGLLTFDTNNKQVVVKGFANLFTLAFSLVWLGLPLSSIVSILFSQQPLVSVLIPLGVIGVFAVMMGIFYLFQASRFSNVAAIAAQSWERKYVRDRDEAQHSVHTTGGSRRVFRQFAWLQVGSVTMALSRPAHQRVTQAVGQYAMIAYISYGESHLCHIKLGCKLCLT